MAEATRWRADSEYGVLRDVLLCPADNFRWLPTSSISRATLASGAVFDGELARRQHAEMAAAYGDAGVNLHYLEPDEHLPYQVYARDSSIVTPFGPIVTQMAQWWRRGEYAAVADGDGRLVRGRRLPPRRARLRRHRLLGRADPGAVGAPGRGLARGG